MFKRYIFAIVSTFFLLKWFAFLQCLQHYVWTRMYMDAFSVSTVRSYKILWKYFYYLFRLAIIERIVFTHCSYCKTNRISFWETACSIFYLDLWMCSASYSYFNTIVALLRTVILILFLWLHLVRNQSQIIGVVMVKNSFCYAKRIVNLKVEVLSKRNNVEICPLVLKRLIRLKNHPNPHPHPFLNFSLHQKSFTKFTERQPMHR